MKGRRRHSSLEVMVKHGAGPDPYVSPPEQGKALKWLAVLP
jgi:hypothetical protein